MSGWNVSVYRQSPPRQQPVAQTAERGEKLAQWQAKTFGLRWFEPLLERGDMIATYFGAGYPDLYTARAKAVLGPVREGPPDANEVWAVPEGSVLLPDYVGRTQKDEEAMLRYSDEEWLIVEVWDED